MKPPKRISKSILEAIMKVANVEQRQAYRMAEQIKRDFAVSLRTAANFVAKNLGIDVQRKKFGLTQQDLTELRGLIGRVQPLIPIPRPRAKGKQIGEKIPVMIGPKVSETILLPPNLARDAIKMSGIYPMVYVLENTFRYLIMKTLENKYGTDWWDKVKISQDIKNRVEIRLNAEHENRWHAQRGTHRIFYTDFNDLARIIMNNWEDFKKVFKKIHRLQTKFEEIENSRHIIAHNNPLPDREIKRLRLNFEDWKRILKRG